MFRTKTDLLKQITNTSPWYLGTANGKRYVFQHSNEHGQGRMIQITDKLYNELLHYAYPIPSLHKLMAKNAIEQLEKKQKEVQQTK